MEPGPCASSPSESCQTRKGAALRRILASAAGRLGSMVGSLVNAETPFVCGERGLSIDGEEGSGSDLPGHA